VIPRGLVREDPDRKTAGRVIANFAQVVKTGELRLHPQIGGLVEKELLGKMGGSARAGRGGVVTTVGKVGDLWNYNGLRVGVRALLGIRTRVT
jgi:hypothetical protein